MEFKITCREVYSASVGEAVGNEISLVAAIALSLTSFKCWLILISGIGGAFKLASSDGD